MAPGGEQEARPRCHPLLLAVQDFTVITIGDGSGERSRSSPMKSPVPLGVARFSKSKFRVAVDFGLLRPEDFSSDLQKAMAPGTFPTGYQ